MIILAVVCFALLGCSGNNEDSRSVVYEDMKAAFEQSGLLSSNIGIFSKTAKDGDVIYGECGSGVIVKKDGGSYYALTAIGLERREENEKHYRGI